jgi:hypothetical protein
MADKTTTTIIDKIDFFIIPPQNMIIRGKMRAFKKLTMNSYEIKAMM